MNKGQMQTSIDFVCASPENGGGCYPSPLVSIVIPFYNASDLLSECIESVVTQIQPELFELLLIDDGSTDTSTAYARAAQRIDPCISFYRSEDNIGVSASRNIGISKAKGAWIVFIDSDDTVPPGALSALAASVDGDIDGLFAGYQVIDSENQNRRLFNGYNKVIDSLEAVKAILDPEGPYQGHVWGKAFRRELLLEKNIRFREGVSFYEDELFLLDYLAASSKIKCIDTICYQYRRHPGQISDFSSLSTSFLDGFSIRDEIIATVCKQWPNAQYLAKARYMLAINSLVKRSWLLSDPSIAKTAGKKMRWDCVVPAIRALNGYPQRQGKVILSIVTLMMPILVELRCILRRRTSR